MDLYDKFNAIEVKANNRISEADKDYCERHQAAYESALTSYAELLRISTQLDKTQKNLLSDDDNKKGRTYTMSDRDVNINEYSVRGHLENLQDDFIRNIVLYFCNTYAISISSSSFQREIAEKCKSRDADVDETEDLTRKTPIKYETVVDLIFKEMDGRSFEEYAMYQLKERCERAIGAGGGLYEHKKAVIRFYDSFCYASTRQRYAYTEETWTLTDRAKSILEALAHFETGKFADYPGPFRSLIVDGESCTDLRNFYGCKKLESLKLFKNGRMDVRFTSPALAAEFEEKYLRNLT